MRLIDADKLIELCHIMADKCDDLGESIWKQFATTVEWSPTIEAEPIKRGRWEPHPSEREWDICSHCHLGTKRREYGLNDDGTEWVTEQSYTHCPWCGAKMDTP